MPNQLTQKNSADYRWLTFSIIALIMGVVVFTDFKYGSYTLLINYTGIETIPYFDDLRILLCGIDAMRLHQNPYTAICPPATDAMFNYPVTWGAFGLFSFVTVPNLIPIGLVLIVLFYTAVYFIAGRLNLFESLVAVLLFMAPCTILALERGNCDLIIFLLMAIAVYRYAAPIFFAACVVLCGVLKLFPVAALYCCGFYYKQHYKKAVGVFLASCILFVAFVLFLQDNLAMVSSKTPRPYDRFSYGAGVLFSLIKYNIQSPLSSIVKQLPQWLYAVLYMGLVFAGFVLFYNKFSHKLPLLTPAINRKNFCFATGSGIFILSSLIGYNFNYRLIFLLLTIPIVFVWIRNGSKGGFVVLGFTFLVMWQSFLSRIIPKWHLAAPFVFFVLLYIHLCILVAFLKVIFRKEVMATK